MLQPSTGEPPASELALGGDRRTAVRAGWQRVAPKRQGDGDRAGRLRTRWNARRSPPDGNPVVGSPPWLDAPTDVQDNLEDRCDVPTQLARGLVSLRQRRPGSTGTRRRCSRSWRPLSPTHPAGRLCFRLTPGEQAPPELASDERVTNSSTRQRARSSRDAVSIEQKVPQYWPRIHPPPRRGDGDGPPDAPRE